MKYIEIYNTLTTDKTPTWKKLKAYCLFVKECRDSGSSVDLELLKDIEFMYPKFKGYVEIFPVLRHFPEEIGDFTYNINRIDIFYDSITGPFSRFVDGLRHYCRAVIRYSIDKSETTINQKYLSNLFYHNTIRKAYYGCSGKYTIFPWDINLFTKPILLKEREGIQDLKSADVINNTVYPILDGNYNLRLKTCFLQHTVFKKDEYKNDY